MSTRFLPVLISADDRAYDEMNVLDPYLDDLGVGYTVGPPYGERLVTWADLDRIDLPRRRLRREAMDNLESMVDMARIHGQPPALWVSFEGMESSLLLVDEFWEDVAESIPGELVVGVPARDVVLITGSQSRTGLAKAARAVDRVFYANRPNLLLRYLLVWRDGQWQVF